MNPLVMPLNIGKDDTFRISWKNRYFKATAALVLPHKISTPEEAGAVIGDAQVVIKLIDFKTDLKSKMLAALSQNSEPAKAGGDIFGIVARLNVKQGKFIGIEDVRATKESAQGGANFLDDSAEVLRLDETEKQLLIKALNISLTPVVLDSVRQPFAAFDASLTETWKDRDLQSIQADKLVPFQMLFPNGQPIERFVDGERYVIDDLYCTNPTCSCTDVTCVVLKFLPHSGTEVAWGGFKWNIESDKLKPLPQFSNKFNAAEWFKQFNAASGFDLKLLLSSRQKFMRNEYITARRAQR
jgi:hypothetical protein